MRRIKTIALRPLISLFAFEDLQRTAVQAAFVVLETLGHGPILAPLTFRPRELHKYYNRAAPWLVALNQIDMQARTTKEIQHS